MKFFSGIQLKIPLTVFLFCVLIFCGCVAEEESIISVLDKRIDISGALEVQVHMEL